METLFQINPTHFLNRLALEQLKDPHSFNPLHTLGYIFSYTNPHELLEQFDQFCAAALAEEYSYELGSPGDLLSFSEQLEELIETCWLIAQQESKDAIEHPIKGLDGLRLPCHLSKAEWQNPGQLLDSFFSYQPLQRWKVVLHEWTRASLSDFSVIQDIEGVQLLPFCQYIQKLIEAAYLIKMRAPSIAAP